MSSLILLSMGLTAFVGALCTLLYSRSQKLNYLALEHKEQLARLEFQLHELMELQLNTHKRIDELASEVLQRDIYQSADDRHQLAIRDAREGKSLAELVRKHGLSTDEAALIMALHSIPASSANREILQASRASLGVSSTTGR